jgi:hypothetical protein
MSFSIKNRHDNVHKYNPSTNYIRLENCRFCVAEKRQGYGKYANDFNIYNDDMSLLYSDFQSYWYNSILEQLSQSGLKPNFKSKISNTIIDIETSDNDICSICLNHFTKRGSILNNCKHIFHKPCLKEWLNYNKSCPLCRRVID